jgi:hypothetical protein
MPLSHSLLLQGGLSHRRQETGTLIVGRVTPVLSPTSQWLISTAAVGTTHRSLKRLKSEQP